MNNEDIFIISDPDRVQEIIEKTERKISEARVPDNIANDVAVALLEAINNAIIHGNERNSNKNVTVRMKITENDIEFCVADQGRGFDPSRLEDPCQPENLFLPSGRGLFFIRKLMDEVEIDTGEDGSRIIMRKRWL
ncbi:MAG TPA: ATP-binding protein [bacterium]|nr:ATP-binding protein [bacterium]